MNLFGNQRCPKCWDEFKITFWAWLKEKGQCKCGNWTYLVDFTDDVLVATHTRSSYHAEELKQSELCGCFYCLTVFNPNEISEWTDGGETALCPKCGIDSVIAGKDNFTNKKFLSLMYDRWFGPPYTSYKIVNGKATEVK